MKYDELIKNFVDNAEEIENLLSSIPQNAFDYKPSWENSWTIRQHVIHLVDSDINNFIRIKSCIAQPYSNIYVIEENDWVKNIEQIKEDIQPYLAVFKLLRNILHSFLVQVKENDFDNKYFIRTYNNETSQISLNKAISNYCEHVKFHIEHISRIMKEFNSK